MLCSITHMSSREITLSWSPTWERKGPGQLSDAPMSVCRLWPRREALSLCTETGVCGCAKTNKNSLVAPV